MVNNNINPKERSTNERFINVNAWINIFSYDCLNQNTPSLPVPPINEHRELYIGNTSPDMTDIVLKDFLSNTMEKVGFSLKPGSPIIHARVSGNFAFVECRSVEETTALLNLNNIPFMGQELKINRPSKYPGPETPHLNWPDVLARYDLSSFMFPRNDFHS